MHGNEWKKWVGGTERMLLAWVLLFAQIAWAGQDPKAPDKVGATPKPAVQQTRESQSSGAATTKVQTGEGQPAENGVEEKKSSSDGSHEGIKVHGHWTIEVRSPNGSLVTRREFENSFIQIPSLSSFLSRTYSVGYWNMSVLGAGAGICSANGVPTDCTIEEAATGYASSSDTFNTLVLSISGNNLVFNGTVIAPLSGNISGVQTTVFRCPPTTPVSSPCAPTAGYSFTAATLSTPIQVSAGQTVAVTVNISFS